MLRHLRVHLLVTAPFFMGAYADGCELCTPPPPDTSGSGDDGGNAGNGPMGGLFTSQVSHIDVEVDFEHGAAPYTGNRAGFGDTWSLFENNADALFSDHPKTITVDKKLVEMEDLGNLADTDFTDQEILAVAAAHRQNQDSATTRSFYVVFLDAYYSGEDGREPNVLAVTLWDTGVIAMFKPVIEGTFAPFRIEQTTLVHEFGHAVGLVGYGLPVVHPAHHDTAHGAHCMNPNCVMYWLNEGQSIVEYVSGHVTSGQNILFDDDCLADTQAASE